MSKTSSFWVTKNNPDDEARKRLMLPGDTMRLLQMNPKPENNTFTYHFPLNPENDVYSGPFISFTTKIPLSKKDVVQLIDQIKQEKNRLLENYDAKNDKKESDSQLIKKSNVPPGISNLLKSKIEAPSNTLKPNNSPSGLTIDRYVNSNTRTEKFTVLKDGKNDLIERDDYYNEYNKTKPLVINPGNLNNKHNLNSRLPMPGL